EEFGPESGMEILAGLVTPAIDYLHMQQVSTAMITNPKLRADWNAIVTAVSPNTTVPSVRSLHQFLVETMGSIDIPTCMTAANKPDTAKAAIDWFLMRRRQF